MQSGSESDDDGLIEQVPHYTLSTLDDGSCEKLELIVHLPGVDSSAGLAVQIGGRRAFVHLPGRYRLDLSLTVEVETKPLKLKFVKKKGTLKAEYEIISRPERTSSFSSSSQSAMGNGLHKTHGEPASDPAPAPEPAAPQRVQKGSDSSAVHDSFLQDALKLQRAYAKASKKGAKGTKPDALPNGDAPVTDTKQQSAGSTGHTGANTASSARTNGHPSEAVSSNDEGAPQELESQRPGLQAPSKAAAPESQKQSQLPGQRGQDAAQSNEQASSRDEHDSLNGGADAAAGIREATGADNDKTPPPLNGFAPESASGRGASEEASGALYEAAKVHSNREAAAECSAKAEEAVSADDFDKAERLYAKAERLAPGEYKEAAAQVAEQRADYESFAAEQAREAKRQKREAEKRKREADKRRKHEESKAEERRRQQAEAAAKAEAEAEAQQDSDGDISGNWGSYSEEPGWARSHAQGPSEFGEIPRWGVPLGPLQVVVSILYAIASFLLFNVLGRRTVLYLERLRHGTRPERVALGAGVVMVWALALRVAWALTWWIVPLLWAVWCAVFWRPSLIAATLETVLAVCLVPLLPRMVGNLFLMPLMWRGVGGGFSAVSGTLCCLASVFIILDPGLAKGQCAWIREWALPVHLAYPMVYALLARLTGWVGQVVLLALSAWHFYTVLWRPEFKPEIPQGMMGTPSCRPEDVPDGAVPEVVKVLRAASWYEVLEVSSSATAEEVKRAHKQKSLCTHPDKVGVANSGAHEAAIRVNMAREVLLSDEKRRAYDAEVLAAESGMHAESDSWQGSAGPSSRRASSAGGGAESMFYEYHGPRKSCANTGEHSSMSCMCMPCKLCAFWHHVHITKRQRHAAYYCQDCSRYHPAVQKQFWRESGLGSMLGLKNARKYYLCLYGVILDITDVMASCSQWSAFGPHCPGPRCSEATTFKGDFLPIREEIFFAFAQANDSVFAQQAQQQACSGGPPRNNKRKARRRR